MLTKSIALKAKYSLRAVNYALKKLCELGVIIKQNRRGEDGSFISSLFTIVGANAPRYNKDLADIPSCNDCSSSCTDCADNNIVFNKIKDSLKGENAHCEENSNSAVIDENQPTLNDVPDIMRTTARYLLQRTGRASLKWSEIEALRALSYAHKPVRVQKEIERACERFLAKGKELITLTFNYIQGALRNQRTFVQKKNPAIASDDDWGAALDNLILGGATA